MKEETCFPYAYPSIRIGWLVCFDCVLQQVPSRLLSWANGRLCCSCVYTTITLPVLHSLCAIWQRIHVLRMSYIRWIGWPVYCMFWLYFLFPRSHPSWTWPVGNFGETVVAKQPNYRYSLPSSSLDLYRIWRRRLALRMLFHIRSSWIGWLVFYMFWLCFVSSRSNSSSIGPIDEFEGAEVKQKPTYWYSTSLFPLEYEGRDLLSYTLSVG